MLRRLTHSLNAVVTIIAAAVMLFMMFHVLVNAVSRFLFRHPIVGTIEYTAFWYMPAVVFVGIYIATVRRTHIDVTILFDRFPPRLQWEAALFANVLFAVTMGAFAWFGWLEAVDGVTVGASAGQSDVPLWPALFIVPLTCGLTAIAVLLQIMQNLRRPDLPPSTSAPEVEMFEAATEGQR